MMQTLKIKPNRWSRRARSGSKCSDSARLRRWSALHLTSRSRASRRPCWLGPPGRREGPPCGGRQRPPGGAHFRVAEEQVHAPACRVGCARCRRRQQHTNLALAQLAAPDQPDDSDCVYASFQANRPGNSCVRGGSRLNILLSPDFRRLRTELIECSPAIPRGRRFARARV